MVLCRLQNTVWFSEPTMYTAIAKEVLESGSQFCTGHNLHAHSQYPVSNPQRDYSYPSSSSPDGHYQWMVTLKTGSSLLCEDCHILYLDWNSNDCLKTLNMASLPYLWKHRSLWKQHFLHGMNGEHSWYDLFKTSPAVADTFPRQSA